MRLHGDVLTVRHYYFGSGGRIRTYDLRVMSPTSCQTAPPRNWYQSILTHVVPPCNTASGLSCLFINNILLLEHCQCE